MASSIHRSDGDAARASTEQQQQQRRSSSGDSGNSNAFGGGPLLSTRGRMQPGARSLVAATLALSKFAYEVHAPVEGASAFGEAGGEDERGEVLGLVPAAAGSMPSLTSVDDAGGFTPIVPQPPVRHDDDDAPVAGRHTAAAPVPLDPGMHIEVGSLVRLPDDIAATAPSPFAYVVADDVHSPDVTVRIVRPHTSNSTGTGGQDHHPADHDDEDLVRRVRRVRLVRVPGQPFRALERLNATPYGHGVTTVCYSATDGQHAHTVALAPRVSFGSSSKSAAGSNNNNRHGSDSSPTWIVSCRGSVTKLDWSANFAPMIDRTYADGTWQSAVHGGFLRRAETIRLGPYVEHVLSGGRLIFTGHSLGSAVAELLCVKLILHLHDQRQFAPMKEGRILFIGYACPVVAAPQLGQRHLLPYQHLFHHFQTRDDIVPLATNASNAVDKAANVVRDTIASAAGAAAALVIPGPGGAVKKAVTENLIKIVADLAWSHKKDAAVPRFIKNFGYWYTETDNGIEVADFVAGPANLASTLAKADAARLEELCAHLTSHVRDHFLDAYGRLLRHLLDVDPSEINQSVGGAAAADDAEDDADHAHAAVPMGGIKASSWPPAVFGRWLELPRQEDWVTSAALTQVASGGHQLAITISTKRNLVDGWRSQLAGATAKVRFEPGPHELIAELPSTSLVSTDGFPLRAAVSVDPDQRDALLRHRAATVTIAESLVIPSDVTGRPLPRTVTLPCRVNEAVNSSLLETLRGALFLSLCSRTAEGRANAYSDLLACKLQELEEHAAQHTVVDELDGSVMLPSAATIGEGKTVYLRVAYRQYFGYLEADVPPPPAPGGSSAEPAASASQASLANGSEAGRPRSGKTRIAWVTKPAVDVGSGGDAAASAAAAAAQPSASARMELHLVPRAASLVQLRFVESGLWLANADGVVGDSEGTNAPAPDASNTASSRAILTSNRADAAVFRVHTTARNLRRFVTADGKALTAYIRRIFGADEVVFSSAHSVLSHIDVVGASGAPLLPFVTHDHLVLAARAVTYQFVASAETPPNDTDGLLLSDPQAYVRTLPRHVAPIAEMAERKIECYERDVHVMLHAPSTTVSTAESMQELQAGFPPLIDFPRLFGEWNAAPRDEVTKELPLTRFFFAGLTNLTHLALVACNCGLQTKAARDAAAAAAKKNRAEASATQSWWDWFSEALRWGGFQGGDAYTNIDCDYRQRLVVVCSLICATQFNEVRRLRAERRVDQADVRELHRLIRDHYDAHRSLIDLRNLPKSEKIATERKLFDFDKVPPEARGVVLFLYGFAVYVAQLDEIVRRANVLCVYGTQKQGKSSMLSALLDVHIPTATNEINTLEPAVVAARISSSALTAADDAAITNAATACRQCGKVHQHERAAVSPTLVIDLPAVNDPSSERCALQQLALSAARLIIVMHTADAQSWNLFKPQPLLAARHAQFVVLIGRVNEAYSKALQDCANTGFPVPFVRPADALESDFNYRFEWAGTTYATQFRDAGEASAFTLRARKAWVITEDFTGDDDDEDAAEGGHASLRLRDDANSNGAGAMPKIRLRRIAPDDRKVAPAAAMKECGIVRITDRAGSHVHPTADDHARAKRDGSDDEAQLRARLTAMIHQEIELTDDDWETAEGQAAILRDLRRAIEEEAEVLVDETVARRTRQVGEELLGQLAVVYAGRKPQIVADPSRRADGNHQFPDAGSFGGRRISDFKARLAWEGVLRNVRKTKKYLRGVSEPLAGVSDDRFQLFVPACNGDAINVDHFACFETEPPPPGREPLHLAVRMQHQLGAAFMESKTSPASMPHHSIAGGSAAAAAAVGTAPDWTRVRRLYPDEVDGRASRDRRLLERLQQRFREHAGTAILDQYCLRAFLACRTDMRNLDSMFIRSVLDPPSSSSTATGR